MFNECIFLTTFAPSFRGIEDKCEFITEIIAINQNILGVWSRIRAVRTHILITTEKENSRYQKKLDLLKALTYIAWVVK